MKEFVDEILSRIIRYFFLSNYHFVGEGVVCDKDSKIVYQFAVLTPNI